MQQPILSSTGLVLHNLGLAAGFGGTLFGKVALNPATRAITSKEERGLVSNLAWNVYNPVNAAGVGLATLTWIIGRSALTGREIDPTTRGMVVAKDILVGASGLLGAANIVAGAWLGKQGAVPMESGSVPAIETPESVAKTQRFVNLAGTVNLVCMAGVIALTSLLNLRSSRSSKWKFVTRMLP